MARIGREYRVAVVAAQVEAARGGLPKKCEEPVDANGEEAQQYENKQQKKSKTYGESGELQRCGL
jgi:hypothetical protein